MLIQTARALAARDAGVLTHITLVCQYRQWKNAVDLTLAKALDFAR